MLLNKSKALSTKYLNAIVMIPGRLSKIVHIKQGYDNQWFTVVINGTTYAFALPAQYGQYVTTQKNKTYRIALYTSSSVWPITELDGDIQKIIQDASITTKLDIDFVRMLQSRRTKEQQVTTSDFATKADSQDGMQESILPSIKRFFKKNSESINELDVIDRLDEQLYPAPSMIDGLLSRSFNHTKNNTLRSVVLKPVTAVKAWGIIACVGLLVGGAVMTYTMMDSSWYTGLFGGLFGQETVEAVEIIREQCSTTHLQTYPNALGIALDIHAGDLDCTVGQLPEPFQSAVRDIDPAQLDIMAGLVTETQP
ncbi:MAG: hypothetical protein F4Y18_02755 [Cenarchaeum sp. SB0663_bin_5]|nr:hypothetical protein [Cenarchaeum sp. SB0663_bin_5]MYL11502.1 hypothetical protein [Cenarchaeum sp. SB0669_bin_11]